ncbi:hypothetical protein DBB_43480 [Desulfoluna spongiiphila]|nr:hypothetical protein DBB_43480 [Desulfoluna spongiiphila]
MPSPPHRLSKGGLIINRRTPARPVPLYTHWGSLHNAIFDLSPTVFPHKKKAATLFRGAALSFIVSVAGASAFKGTPHEDCR